MSGSVYPVWIDSSAGNLFAIVHEPEDEKRNGAVIVMPSAGQDVRVGPQRIYLKAAWLFARERELPSGTLRIPTPSAVWWPGVCRRSVKATLPI
jgi:hypothetical protein